MSSSERHETRYHYHVSAFLLITGFFLIMIGYRETMVLFEQINSLFSVSPNTYSRSVLILGVAFTVAGFVGLIRGKTI